MAELQIPDYMQNKPVDVASLFDLYNTTRANQQAMKMNEMKMAEEQQTAPLRQRYMQSQAAENESTASINQLKAHQQKLALGSNIAKQILGQASKVAQEGTPEFEQAVQQYGNPLRQIMASAFGHENDPSKPIDVNGLKSLASMDIGESNQDWVEINDVRGHFMMNKKNGEVKPVEHGGRQLQSPVYDIGTQYGISLSHKIPEEVAKGAIPLTSGPSIVQQGLFPNQQQQQARQQVHIDPNMSPEDQVTAQRDWANYQQGIANQNAQNGGVPAPSGGIPSMAEREGIKTQANIEQSVGTEKAKNEAELKQAKDKRLQSTAEMLNLLDSKKTVGDTNKTIEQLIKESTSTKTGQAVDVLARELQHPTEGSKALAGLGLINKWVTSFVPRMEGPQSNFDVQNYQEMAGNIADPNKSVEEKLTSYRAMIKMLKTYMESGGNKSTETPFNKLDATQSNEWSIRPKG